MNLNKRNLRTSIAGALGLLLMILDGKTALAGAIEGVNLCFTTLVPSLFPFFVLSVLLTGALSGQALPFLRPIAKICKVPQGAESLLAIGFLGGYPVGAQNVAIMHRAGQISDMQAARMIAICNNAGPAFIFGILGSMFSDPKIPWFLWAIHIISAFMIGILLPTDADTKPATPLTREIKLTDALEQAVKVMALVCGWVILMRIILAFLERWFLWLLPTAVQITVCGIIELSNGCVRLAQIDSEGLRFIIASGLLSLGGICVTLQTASVTKNISMKLYYPGKLLECCISILLSYLIQPLFLPAQPVHFRIIPISAATGAFLLISYLRIFEKSSRIPSLVSI